MSGQPNLRVIEGAKPSSRPPTDLSGLGPLMAKAQDGDKKAYNEVLNACDACITAFKSMNIDLPAGSELYADSGYTDYELEDYYKEMEQIHLLVMRKSNSKRPDHPALAFLKTMMRKRIETTFSEITAFFPRKIHAVTPQGFLLKVILIIFAYTLNRVI